MIYAYNQLANLALEILSLRSGRSIDTFQEPDYTAALTTIFPQLLNWFGVNGCRYGGCFIHQKPKVSFNSTVKGGMASCEAGDLLVLVRQTIDGVVRYNATLFQIKMHHNNTSMHHISGQGEFIQKELYTDWPRFSITSSGVPIYFDIHPKTITSGAQYMTIKNIPNRGAMINLNGTKFYNSIPASSMFLDRFCSFGHFLDRMLRWQTGRPISAPNSITEDWSKFIWKLIDVSRTSVYNRRNVGVRNGHRANGDFFSLLTEGMPQMQELYLTNQSYIKEEPGSLAERLSREIHVSPDAIDGNYQNVEDDELHGISTLFIDLPSIG